MEVKSHSANNSSFNSTFNRPFTKTGPNGLQERNKHSVAKKIIIISSVKQEVKKLFLKILQLREISSGFHEKIVEYSRTVLDNDKQKQLIQHLKFLEDDQYQKIQFPYWMMNLVKFFVISPAEKSYITRIQKELRDDEQLDLQIKHLQKEIQAEKSKKLKIYELEKSGVIVAGNKPKNSTKQVQNFENKLMRANQKLNQLCTNNGKLREKINQLRKQKNSMEEIYSKLKKQLELKKENVQNTIKYAGQAYAARNKAEEQLKQFKQQAEIKKQQYKIQCQKLNNQIQHDIRFKQFIKSKQIEKDQILKLEEQIRLNQESIEIKRQQNARIERQYQTSIEKEAQIQKAFDRLKRQIGFGNPGSENQGQELLAIFVNLYEKNLIMKKFVEELALEVEDLEKKIEQRKKQIQQLYAKGSVEDSSREKLNENLKVKFEYQQKKKKILQLQYQKSVSTIGMIKQCLQDIFSEIGADPETTQKLKTCTLNEQNLDQFLGQLQRRGLEAIAHYGSLVAGQLRAEKANSPQLQKQIDQLSNIITLQNVSHMNGSQATPPTNPLNQSHFTQYSTTKHNQYPSELIIKAKQDHSEEGQKMLNAVEFKKYALQSLEGFNRKHSIPKFGTKKFNAVPMLSKSKKK